MIYYNAEYYVEYSVELCSINNCKMYPSGGCILHQLRGSDGVLASSCKAAMKKTLSKPKTSEDCSLFDTPTLNIPKLCHIFLYCYCFCSRL